MGKNLLVGVGGKARHVKALYVGVGGKARKVKKVYVGVGGKARLVYQSYIPVTGISITNKVYGSYSSPSKYPLDGTLTAAIAPSNATNPTITWTLSDTTHFTFIISKTWATIGNYGYWKYTTAATTTGSTANVLAIYDVDDYNDYRATVTAKSADGPSVSQGIHRFPYKDRDGDRDIGFEWY